MKRGEREARAYDEDGVFVESDRWHRRFPHVFGCENTQRAEAQFLDWLATAAAGRAVLELGCGDGGGARKLLEVGAASVLGVDVSRTMIDAARARGLERADFTAHDLEEPILGRFGLIWGRAILHHLEWRPMVQRWYRENLAPGGAMIFYEPLGDSPLLRAYWRLARGAHTEDEEALHGGDLDFLRAEFPGLELAPVNLVSLPAGVVSSKVFGSAANPLMRWADAIDRGLQQLPAAHRYFRQVMIRIRKPDPAL
jgi:SAM-dependent methyltransferase